MDSLALHLLRAPDPLLEPLPVFRGLMDIAARQGNLGVRVITWAHELDDYSTFYMGFIIIQRKGLSAKIIKLHDRYLPLQEGRVQEEWLTFSCGPADWLGAAYYAIQPFTYAGNSCFALCGVAGGSPLVVRRVVETLVVDPDGRISFGIPVIQYQQKRYARLLFSHNARVAMTLHPIPANLSSRPLILIDHLSPSRSQYGGIPQYYGPDGTQDALRLQKDGSWLFETDVLVKAPSVRGTAH